MCGRAANFHIWRREGGGSLDDDDDMVDVDGLTINLCYVMMCEMQIDCHPNDNNVLRADREL